MNDTDCLFDDLLCRSLSLFHQFRLYDDCVEEDNAFKALREAEKIVSNTRNGICVAKLGCVIECLAHRFYIDDDTDGVLGEVDTFLIKFSKGLKHPSAEAFVASLWMGEDFFLSLRNPVLIAGVRRWCPKCSHLWRICFTDRKNKRNFVFLPMMSLRKRWIG